MRFDSLLILSIPAALVQLVSAAPIDSLSSEPLPATGSDEAVQADDPGSSPGSVYLGLFFTGDVEPKPKYRWEVILQPSASSPEGIVFQAVNLNARTQAPGGPHPAQWELRVDPVSDISDTALPVGLMELGKIKDIETAKSKLKHAGQVIPSSTSDPFHGTFNSAVYASQASLELLKDRTALAKSSGRGGFRELEWVATDADGEMTTNGSDNLLSKFAPIFDGMALTASKCQVGIKTLLLDGEWGCVGLPSEAAR